MVAVLTSILLVSIGYMAGLPLWSSAWSLDLADLGGIPLILWLLYRVFNRDE